MSNHKWIIFDNDGVLVDTEGAFLHANRTVLNEYGISFSDQCYQEVCLNNGQSILEYHLKDPSMLEEAYASREDLYQQTIHNGDRSFPGVRNLLALLSQYYNIGVVTGASKATATTLLRNAELERFLQFVITADDFSQPKPSPEPYLIAHERYQVPFESALVVEDTIRGWRSATEAGFSCLLVDNHGLLRVIEKELLLEKNLQKVYSSTEEVGQFLLTQVQ